jgi:hypothetical protein
MSIWHFKVSPIPEKALCAKYGDLPHVIATDLAEDSSLWSDIEPLRIERLLNAILPEANSWSDSMRIWGDENSDSAWICYMDEKKERVEWVDMRIDVRNLSRPFVAAICMLAKELECVLLTDQHEIVPPNEGALLAAIDSSIAKGFLKDPISTLRSLRPQREPKA